MTKEQAKEILKQRECCRECVVNNGDCNDCDKAFEMAIKALEQQPSDDCVSRQAVIDTVDNTIAKYIPTFIGPYEKIPLELARAIKDVPPVTPTLHKSATNGEEIIRAFPNLKYTIQNGRVVTTIGVASSFDLEWWNDIYKRGDSDGSN